MKANPYEEKLDWIKPIIFLNFMFIESNHKENKIDGLFFSHTKRKKTFNIL
jgi:hypothetical protein